MKMSVLITAALMVGAVWTIAFGALWQWVPIIAGCVIGLAVKKAVRGGS